ncbi:uncharacterized protein BDZ99DRAFT_509712 [Mytilinidion resinicola]|uniref:histidine kinase n=1 Tax=Mytilinidion resinicola TaxID=574789 RepID=A0A6A6YI63_9PEZI|nr:uncharacterized protein BDZ99DRAFT_509712 [Mytilinidion resinicola]KAF2808470.1 hypothetical protein BDZ99DRAFT_509712 [Mytilinidion resinicola]
MPPICVAQSRTENGIVSTSLYPKDVACVPSHDFHLALRDTFVIHLYDYRVCCLESAHAEIRQLHPQWNMTMFAASIAISFLGAFTSTQLMCHARMSLHFSSVLIWSLFGSMIFGFCSIWSLHEVAMLACEFDLRIGVNAPLTILSSFLAVFFTFVALATDLLWGRYSDPKQGRRRKSRWISSGRRSHSSSHHPKPDPQGSSAPLLTIHEADNDEGQDSDEPMDPFDPPSPFFANTTEELAAYNHNSTYRSPSISSEESRALNRLVSARSQDEESGPNSVGNGIINGAPSPSDGITSDYFGFGVTSTYASSGSMGISNTIGMIYRKSTVPAKNAFLTTADMLYTGSTRRNFGKGFLWSLAITSMHYVGIFALHVPSGYFRFNPWLVFLSALISWTVCTVGCILMEKMETYLPQQILFSVIASVGVAAMHTTGMFATTFYSSSPPSDVRGYPPALANAVVGIAFITCIAANVLLAHSATVSRNKLAEIVSTRKELWKTIALKETAEAASRARSDFIASASHEIRTPLHHLQGYSDLLAQTELTEEGRSLLTSIQRATKTLSLITNNVLDWSKFERDSESSYRPTALDIRAVCESVIVLLPNIDDEGRVQLFVIVAPDVPKTLFLDETYIHRILMNLLSNALKFTRSGYVLLSIEILNDNLIVKVKDTGCGLDPTFIPDMWTPFKQGEVRGSARGTGLGLSIIKRLLARMNASIDLDTKYMHSEDVGPENSGTTLTVTIPMQSTMTRPATTAGADRPRIAILSKNMDRSMEGLRSCWESFGYEVDLVPNVTGLTQGKWKYIWAELTFLNENIGQFNTLSKKKNLSVLVPYDTHDSLEGLPGILSLPNFIMLPRPLIWHTFERRITASKHRRQPTAPLQALRFAAEVEVLNEELNGASNGAFNGSSNRTSDGDAKEKPQEEPAAKHVILLVEDNPINQKLATKMLILLGYRVIAANNGQEAIEQIIMHDTTVDIILMDQSMPVKDGVTATREIRALEAAGTLSRRRPIIAVTAVVNSEAQGAFRKAGADDFLAKPLSLNVLKDTLVWYLPHG